MSGRLDRIIGLLLGFVILTGLVVLVLMLRGPSLPVAAAAYEVAAPTPTAAPTTTAVNDRCADPLVAPIDCSRWRTAPTDTAPRGTAPTTTASRGIAPTATTAPRGIGPATTTSPADPYADIRQAFIQVMIANCVSGVWKRGLVGSEHNTNIYCMCVANKMAKRLAPVELLKENHSAHKAAVTEEAGQTCLAELKSLR